VCETVISAYKGKHNYPLRRYDRSVAPSARIRCTAIL